VTAARRGVVVSNEKTAKALGLAIPPPLAQRAGVLIE